MPLYHLSLHLPIVFYLQEFQLFENTDVLRIFAEPFAENAASCRVLEKAGFQLEGVLRRNAVKNGQVRDMRLYSLVREDLE